MSDLKPLSRKHQRVLDEYLICFSQWRAYQAVYPNTTYDSAKAASSKLFTDVNFLAHLSDRLNEVHMSADEALKLVTDIARGDVTEFITPFGNIDIDLLRKSGKGRLIKKIKQKTVTKIGKGEKDEDTEILDTEIELYDAQAAQRDLLKIHGKFLERVDVTSGGEKVKGFIGWTPENWKQDEKE